MNHKEALEKAAERLRVASRRFAEMGNDSFSAVGCCINYSLQIGHD